MEAWNSTKKIIQKKSLLGERERERENSSIEFFFAFLGRFACFPPSPLKYPFQNHERVVTMIQKNGKDSGTFFYGEIIFHLTMIGCRRNTLKRSHLEVPMASISAIQNFWDIWMIVGGDLFFRPIRLILNDLHTKKDSRNRSDWDSCPALTIDKIKLLGQFHIFLAGKKNTPTCRRGTNKEAQDPNTTWKTVGAKELGLRGNPKSHQTRQFQA